MDADRLRGWTEELARDPRSLVFLRLADLLRRRGRLDEAREVAHAGLERHPYHPDAHDILARILVDSGDEGRARDEWEMALRLDPGHAGALKGLGFLAWRRGDAATAARLLAQAVDRDPEDTGLAAAHRKLLEQLQANVTPLAEPSDEAGRPAGREATATGEGLFDSVFGDGERTALLLDRDGLLVAGSWAGGGATAAEEAGAQFAGLAAEAGWALEQLGLGEWESLLVEAERATVAMGPAPDESIVLVVAAPGSQVGLVRRLLARATRRAGAWLESVP